MPYRRPQQAPTPEMLVPEFEAAIRSLVRRFRTHPYAFYTETDMHCYLYHRLYSGGLVNGLYRTSDGRETILLHKEYPTATRYCRGEGGKLIESDLGRRRGAIDISIWDPAHIGAHEHRRQKVLCAAELALNECGAGNPHTFNDSMKLTGAANEIRYGYLLFFVRDDPTFKRNELTIRDGLKDAAESVRVALVQVDGDNKPKPEYLGAWGVV